MEKVSLVPYGPAIVAESAPSPCVCRVVWMVCNTMNLIKILLPVFAQVGDDAGATAWPAGDAGIAPVQDQPVVRVVHELLRHHPQQTLFDLVDVLAGCDAGAVGDAKDMGIDGNGRLAEGGVEDDIGRLASDPGQRLQCRSFCWYLATMLFLQHGAGPDDVFRLGVVETRRIDQAGDLFARESGKLLRCGCPGQQPVSGDGGYLVFCAQGDHGGDQDVEGIHPSLRHRRDRGNGGNVSL